MQDCNGHNNYIAAVCTLFYADRIFADKVGKENSIEGTKHIAYYFSGFPSIGDGSCDPQEKS